MSSLGSAMFISLFIYIVAFLFSRLTNNQVLESQAKAEIAELLSFFIVYLILFIFIQSLEMEHLLKLTADFVGKRVDATSSLDLSKSLEELANLKLDDINDNITFLMDKHNNLTKALTKYSLVQANFPFFSSPGGLFSPGSFGDIKELGNPASSDANIAYSPCRGLTVITSFLSYLGFSISLSVMAVQFQRVLLSIFSTESAVVVLLFVGFLLRSNPITRAIGSLFLALALSLTSILPFVVLVGNHVVSITYQQLSFLSRANDFYNELEPHLSLGAAVCLTSKAKNYASQIAGLFNDSLAIETIGLIASFPFNVMLAQAIVLLSFVSLVGGISKAFKAEISPYVIGRLTYYLSGG